MFLTNRTAMQKESLTKVKMHSLTDKADKLVEKMYKQVCEFVKANGGFIRTDNLERDEEDGQCDELYAYIHDEDSMNMCHRILAVQVVSDVSDDLWICTTLNAEETINGMTDNEVIHLGEDEDNGYWNYVKDGYVLALPTLYNLCEALYEYVE